MAGKSLEDITEAELVEQLRKAVREASDAIAELRRVLKEKQKEAKKRR